MGRDKKSDSLEIAYVPVSVLDLLKKLKDVSSLMTDLSYYSFIYNNKEIACKVHELEEEIDRLYYLLIMNGTLAVRDREDAEAVTGIIQIGNALDMISNAAADIAKIVLDDLAPTEFVKEAFNKAEEIVVSTTISEKGEIGNKPISYLEENDIFVDIIAVKRTDEGWVIDPSEDFVLKSGYTVIIRGTEEQIDKFFKANGDEPFTLKFGEREETDESLGKNILLDRIIEMKDKIELMLDLAYSAVMLNDAKIAHHVLHFENYFDWLEGDYEFLVLSLMNQFDLDKSKLIALIRLGVAAESMADGAAKIAEVVARGLKPHPILKRVFDESEEFLTTVEIKHDSSLVGKTVGYLEEKFGVQVVAVGRGNRYFLDADEDFVLRGGDIVIIRGFYEARDDLIKSLKK
ncbi:MAG: potassium channel family protein [Candidatus Njordarchaeia archaeon]